MRHHVRLIWAYFRTSLQRETAFQANFYINVMNTALGLFSGLAGITILFSQVETFQGWTYPQALALLGVFMTIGPLLNLFIWPSLNTLGDLGGEVWQGTFDFTLLKPVSAQFQITFRNWGLWEVVNLAVGLAVLGRALTLMGQSLTPSNLAAFIFSMVIAMLIGYSILLILTTGVFYYLGAPLSWVFGILIEMGRYPIGIYPYWIRLLLTWVIPVGFMTTIPTQVLVGQGQGVMLLSGAVLALLLLLVSSVFFRRSIKRYASASS